MALLRTLLLAGPLAASLLPGGARAAAFHVHARTEAQAYQLRAFRGAGPEDVTLLPRRRVVQSLGLDAFELVTGEDFGFESNLRVYADFGLPRGEAERVDGLRSEDVDLLYANLRWRRGGFAAVLGRQVFTDAAEYFSFDGARVRYVLPVGLGAEAYAGLWVKGASLLGSPAHGPEGLRETEAGLPGDDPLFALLDEAAGPEPVFGARVVAENVAGSGASASAGYRRSFVQGGGVSSERATAELNWASGNGVTLFSSAEFDLLLQRFAGARAHLRYDGARFAVSAEAVRFAPAFSAYSLWYYFATAPRDEVRVRGDLLPPGPLRLYAQATGARYGTTTNEALAIDAFARSDEAASPTVLGAGGGAQWSTRTLRSGVDASWRNGWGGRQLWLDVTGGYTGRSRVWAVDARFSVASVRDAQNPLLRGEFYGAQVWGSLLLAQGARASVVLEQNVNPFTRSDTRAYLVVDLRAAL